MQAYIPLRLSLVIEVLEIKKSQITFTPSNPIPSSVPSAVHHRHHYYCNILSVLVAYFSSEDVQEDQAR